MTQDKITQLPRMYLSMGREVVEDQLHHADLNARREAEAEGKPLPVYYLHITRQAPHEQPEHLFWIADTLKVLLDAWPNRYYKLRVEQLTETELFTECVNHNGLIEDKR